MQVCPHCRSYFLSLSVPLDDPFSQPESVLPDESLLPERDPHMLLSFTPGFDELRSGGLLDPGAPSSPGVGCMIMAPSDPFMLEESGSGFMAPSRVASLLSGLVMSGPPCPTAPPDPLPLPSWACNPPSVNKRMPLAMTR